MYFEEQSRALIERADYLLRKSRLIQQKADGATKNVHKVIQANYDLIALLESCRHLPPTRIHTKNLLKISNSKAERGQTAFD